MADETAAVTSGRTDGILDHRNRAYRVLYDTVCEVEGVSEGEILEILCRNLRKLCGAESVAVATHDHPKNSLRLEVVDYGMDAPPVRLGPDPAHRITVLPEWAEDLRKRVIRPCDDRRPCLASLFPDSEPAAILRERKTGARYTLSCVRDGSLVALFGVDMPPGRELPLENVVETYLGTTGMILQRVADVRELREAHAQTAYLLSSIPVILVGVGENDRVTHWNRPAEEVFGVEEGEMAGRRFREAPLDWDWDEFNRQVEHCRRTRERARIHPFSYTRRDGKECSLDITLNPFHASPEKPTGYLLVGEEITERRTLESQLIHAQKMESIGSLAAGIAHEINTPAQFVGDNLTFLRDSVGDLTNLLGAYDRLLRAARESAVTQDVIAEVESAREAADVEYLIDELPKAIEQSSDGISRVSSIVRAMKEFSHPDGAEMTVCDLTKAVENTVTVAKNEWKYVADVETEFDPALPPVVCLPGEINQVILNLVTNAAHAIGDVIDTEKGEKGKIRISTKLAGDHAEIRVADTGGGIPENVRKKIFDPFFTTKPVGRGTGQGLAIIHNSVVNKHQGEVTFETETGKGTTFIVRLPLRRAEDE
ncbi:MAG: ATP-binding protein [Candidatus Eisenbacteria bacterium]